MYLHYSRSSRIAHIHADGKRVIVHLGDAIGGHAEVDNLLAQLEFILKENEKERARERGKEREGKRERRVSKEARERGAGTAQGAA